MVERSWTEVRLDGPVAVRPEPQTLIVVAQALGKGDRFEQVVQHGTEVGATVFVPVAADRCVATVRAVVSRGADRLARWNQIAKDAAQQCGRCRIPVVMPPVQSRELLRLSKDAENDEGPNSETELRLLLHTDADATPIRAVLDAQGNHPARVTIAIGPEGGWSPDEVRTARASGWLEVAIGPYVLRTETAALVAITRIMHCFED